MENPIKMDDLGGTIIFGNTQMCFFLKPPTRRPSHEKSLDNSAEIYPISKFSNTSL